MRIGMPEVRPMIGFLKKLGRDRRGNILAIAGATIPLVVGAAGLATDTIQWVTWKRELQRQADSAAFAGVLAQTQSANVTTAVNTDIAKNNNHNVAILSGYPQISFPASGMAGVSGAVKVTLAIQKRLSFSSFFMSSPPIITTSATAALVDDGIYCAGALNPKAVASLTLGGSSNVNLGCKAISNGSACPSVATNGASYNFATTGVSGASCMPTSINGTDSANLKSWQPPLQDPFKDKYPTDIPDSAKPCKNFNTMTYGANKVKAGCFSNFKVTGNSTYTLDPGVYYLDSTDFDVAGGVTLIGNGVTFILTGSDPGSVKTNGNTGIQLSAPTSGTYEKMLFIQSSAADEDNLNEINGNNTSSYDGALYFPKGKVQFTGSTGSMTKCVMVMAWTLEFTGNANLQNNVSGCTANKTFKGQVLRLIG